MLDTVAKMFKSQPQQQQQMTAEPARSSDVVSQQPVRSREDPTSSMRGAVSLTVFIDC